MSNKSRLQTNNTNLQALINKANALPDAGGGGGSDGNFSSYTVTVDASVVNSTLGLNVLYVAYTKSDGSYYEDALCITGIYTQTYNDVSGTLVLYDGIMANMFDSYSPTVDGGVMLKAYDYNVVVCEVTHDGTITLG